MAASDLAVVLERLESIVGEECRVVTYKWLARNFCVSADFAKRALYVFWERYREKSSAVYYISGRRKGDGQQVVQLVPEAALEGQMRELDPVLSVHIHSVAPRQARSSTEVWSAGHEQARQLFAKLLLGDESSQVKWLRDNTCSPILCDVATRDGGVGPRRAGMPAPQPAVLQETVLKSYDSKSNEVTVTSAEKVMDAKAKPQKESKKPPMKGMKGSVVAAMQTKATEPLAKGTEKLHQTAAKEGVEELQQTAAAKGTEILHRTPAEAGPGSDMDEDPVVFRNRATGKKRVFEDDDENEEAVPENRRPKKKTPSISEPVEVDIDGKDGGCTGGGVEETPAGVSGIETAGMGPVPTSSTDLGRHNSGGAEKKEQKASAAKKTAGKRKGQSMPKTSSAKKPKASATQSDDGNQAMLPVLEQAADVKPEKEGPCPVQGADSGQRPASAPMGTIRRRAVKTYYNDKGEEVTEVVLEDVCAEDLPVTGQEPGASGISQQPISAAGESVAAKTSGPDAVKKESVLKPSGKSKAKP
ncbi:unnamed protein product, partial [Ostreobium quekettii]